MLNDGFIVEEGTYDNLVEKNGAFADLVQQLEAQQSKVCKNCNFIIRNIIVWECSNNIVKEATFNGTILQW